MNDNSLLNQSEAVDEIKISIDDIIQILWKSKYKIALITLVFAGLGIAVALIKPEVFESKIVIVSKEESNMPSLSGVGALLANNAISSSLEKYKPILLSNDLAAEMITKYHLIYDFYPSLVDSTTHQWKKDIEKIPTVLRAVQLFHKSYLKIDFGKKEDQTLTIAIQSDNAKKSFDWVKKFYEVFLSHIEKTEKWTSDEAIEYYRKKIAETNNIEAKKSISNLLASEIKKGLLAGRRKFIVVDKARVPEIRLSPNRRMIVLMWIIVGMCVSSAFFIYKSLLKKDKYKES